MNRFSFFTQARKASSAQTSRSDNNKPRSETMKNLSISIDGTNVNKSNIKNEDKIEKTHEFYFDSKVKKKIIMKTINKYMSPNPNPEADEQNIIIPEKRFSKTAQTSRSRPTHHQRLHRTIQFKNIQSTISVQLSDKCYHPSSLWKY